MRRPLRIRVLGLNYAPEPTGIAPYTTGAARFLADAGHDVHVVTGLPHYPQWRVADGYRQRPLRERDGTIRITRVVHPVPSHPAGRQRIAMEAVFALRAARIVGPRPDVVLAVSPALLTVAAALRWTGSGRTALGVVAQDLYGRAMAETNCVSGREARLAARLERGLLQRADGVVAIHERFRASLTSLGVDATRITTIRNWAHLTGIVGDVAAARSDLGWREGEVVALHAGNMGVKQGLENVVAAARLADGATLPVRFVLLGTGNQRAHLERLGAGVQRLQFIDPLPGDRFETAMAAADVLVLNERPEVVEMCVPSKLTSYFAAGRPVVAATSADSAASSEVAVSGGGVRVAPGRPDELLEAVLAAGRDRAGSLAMGLRGQLFARDHLAEDAARSAYVDFVERLAASRSGHAVPVPRLPADAAPAAAPLPAPVRMPLPAREAL